ncbi:MAG: TatD family hydrolase [Pseudohongiellaceae bacterium]
MKLVDIGANLTHQSFVHDLGQVIARAEAADLAHIIITGTDLDSSAAALELTQTKPGLFSCTAGFHPHVAAACSQQQLGEIAQLAKQSKVVAVGETGLDFNRNYSPREDQLRTFERHLQLAIEIEKPLFLHQRDAHEAFYKLLKKYREELTGGVVHCFTDSESALADYVGLDMYVGITAWICDEKRGRLLRTLVSQIPSDRLLVETDAPYLLPKTLSPKPKIRRNEPCYLGEILRTLSTCTGRSVEQLARETTQNAVTLFKLQLE